MATYYIDAVNGSDSNAGTSEGAGNAWLTIGKASGASVADGDTVNIKNNGTYTITVAITFSTANVLYRGYTTTAGDGGRFTLTCATNAVVLAQIAANGIIFQDFILTHTAGTRARGFVASAADRAGLQLINGKIDGCTYGVDGEWTTNFNFLHCTLQNVEIANCSTVGAAFSSGRIVDCLIRDCADGFRRGGYASNDAHLSFIRTRIYNSTTYAFSWASNIAGGVSFTGCVLRLSGSDLIRFAHTSTVVSLFMEDTIVYGAGGYGITSAFAVKHTGRNNAFRSNTSGDYNATYFTRFLGDISLSGDPHTNAATYDFSLNNTAGAGASCRAAGFSPTVGGTSYHDVGGVQHADPADGGSMYSGTFVRHGGSY